MTDTPEWDCYTFILSMLILSMLTITRAISSWSLLQEQLLLDLCRYSIPASGWRANFNFRTGRSDQAVQSLGYQVWIGHVDVYVLCVFACLYMCVCVCGWHLRTSSQGCNGTGFWSIRHIILGFSHIKLGFSRTYKLIPRMLRPLPYSSPHYT